MKKLTKKILLVNAVGTLGYVGCFLLWTWTVLIYLPLILENDQVKYLLFPTPSPEPTPVAASAEVSPLMMIFAIIITIAVIAITVLVLLRLPAAVAKTGKTVTTKAAGSAIPIVTRGRKVTQAKQRRLTVRLIKLAKLLLATVPVIIAALGVFFTLPLPYDIVMFTSSTLAFFTLLFFSAQYTLAYLFKANLEEIV